MASVCWRLHRILFLVPQWAPTTSISPLYSPTPHHLGPWNTSYANTPLETSRPICSSFLNSSYQGYFLRAALSLSPDVALPMCWGCFDSTRALYWNLKVVVTCALNEIILKMNNLSRYRLSSTYTGNNYMYENQPTLLKTNKRSIVGTKNGTLN